MRQYLYFCTSKCVSICTFVLVNASDPCERPQPEGPTIVQYLYFCTSKCERPAAGRPDDSDRLAWLSCEGQALQYRAPVAVPKHYVLLCILV